MGIIDSYCGSFPHSLLSTSKYIILDLLAPVLLSICCHLSRSLDRNRLFDLSSIDLGIAKRSSYLREEKTNHVNNAW
jgi:hypothetical protein